MIPIRHSAFVIRHFSRAFTLIETLVVVTLVALLLTLSINSLSGAINAQRLSTAAALLENDLRMTAILAVKENRPIYLRFTQTGEPPQYRGWQLVGPDPATGTLQELSTPQKLPEGVVFLDHEDFSNILQLDPIAGYGLFFGYTRSGDTTLPKSTGSRWCLTLAEEARIIPDAETPPKNYRTLVINAHTGSVAVY
ncbi:MAG: Verru_Chthon cassette protein D [Prosthecobacter sp.]|uniref:Verru_Chthon cassette protein D n=1 Tax=Prosthecobacter sp. TaxID=1965333 RepID=UPI00390178CC